MSVISINPAPVLIKIWDATAGELKHLRRPKPRIEELNEAIVGLEDKVVDINSRISQPEREGQILQLWLREVEELKGKAVATEQDFERRRCLGGWSWNCFSINRRVAKRMEEIDKLMTRSDATPVAKRPAAVLQIPTSNSTFGIEAYMWEILGYIDSATVGVIGVYGMGGVGKTTLLTSINNHRNVAVFEHVIWAVASKECKVEMLQTAIAKRLGLQLEEDDTEIDRATKLCDFLRNKDCLLLLDDLWEPLDLAMLGMVASSGQGEQKRKVVVLTTRSEKVCGSMNASRKMEIKCLEQKEAWELFRRNAGEDAIGSDAGIEHIAQQIAEECAGLPLALVTVGKAMSTKKSFEAWNNALTLMKKSQIPKVTGKKKEDPIFSAFKLSYDSLEDDDMRGCLLSCALWPEDHSIEKEKLIECWMGLGLIDEEGVIHKVYDMGHSHIETLKAACLLEPGDDEEKEVKMHDVIRDMALWMASDCGKKKFKWIVRAGVAASQALEEEAWHEAERVSLMDNDIASLPNQLPTCSRLSVLMLKCNWKLKEIGGTLIQAMRSLTYLDLENTQIKEIPKEIGMLSQLRYLNLSNTEIKELPAELGCLVNLNYLLLRETDYLTVVAKGTISNLSSLRFMDLRGSQYTDWLDELEGLKGCHKYSIGIHITTAAALQRLCSLSHVSIWRLNVSGFHDSANPNQLLDEIIKSRNTRQSIEQLKIENKTVKELLIGEGNEQAGGLECLKYLELHLDELEEITWKGVLPQIVFPNLRKLKIWYCNILRNVNWILELPILSVLEISCCQSMVELISDESIFNSSSFGLRKMTLTYMGKLERISRRPLCFQNLEEIEVRDCPHLRKLPFFENKLRVIQCEQKWWNNLEWENESIKNSLWPLVAFGKNLLPLAVEQIPISYSMVGIEGCMRMILAHIARAKVAKVIGVYGMSGVGKTTLLRSIQKRRDVVSKFDHVIWAVASKECKMDKLQVNIANRLKLHIEEDDTERDRTNKLFDLLESRDCLLLLDDLWAPLDLTKLGMARAMPGRRKQKHKVVVFTTCNEQVCDDMNAGAKMEIKCLEQKQAWELFRRNAGEDAIGSDAGIEHIAQQIAEECAGLPLALVTVGKAMSTKKSWEAWNNALTLMKKSQIPKVTGEKKEDPIFSAFELSYDSLEDDDMRGCLLSCALWPEEHSIEKEKLIECWMGLGLIDEEGAIHKVYNRGHSHIETLKAAYLLEPGDDEEKEVKMHGVIRDMALWMASDCGQKKFKWIVRAVVAASQALEEEPWDEAERVSLMDNDIASLPNQLPTCSRLSVLMLQCNWKLKEIGGTLIQAMRSLTYLDLENTRITEIPKEIGMLSQLRYLNLSNTKIKELPAELGCLVNLNYLLLRDLRLTAVAKGTISNLSSLRFMDLRGSRDTDWLDVLEGGSKYKDWLDYWLDGWLDELEGLKGCQKSSIGIDIRTAASLRRLCSLSHVSIWRLNVIDYYVSANQNQLLDDIIKSHNTRQSIEQLKISNVRMKELLISEGNEVAGGLECLKYLNLSKLFELEEITWKGVLPQIVFPNLRELRIYSCTSLRNVNWILQLPSLNNLEVSFCNDMVELISDEGISSSSCFGLRRMRLFMLNKLERISRRPLYFQNLEKIEVRYCSCLKKPPFFKNFENGISMNRLKEILCEYKWWEDLEWEDVNIKDALLPFVAFIRTDEEF